MGWLAERVGVRWTVMFGALMIGAGLAVSTIGGQTALYLGHGLLIGLFGNAGINAPLYVYVARWFDRRRGTAVALLSSGQSVAGMIWPMLFERGIASLGWRHTMLIYALFEIAVICPRRPWSSGRRPMRAAAPRQPARREDCRFPVLRADGDAAGASGGVVQRPRHAGGAWRGDAVTAARLRVPQSSVLGVVADRIGGLRTVLTRSVCQIVAMTGFLLTQDEAGLFAVAAIFGFGFSGIIPAYVVAIRELFPAAGASWRIPTVLLFSGSGMAARGWLAGAIYDFAGFYGAAFVTGIVFNLVHIANHRRARAAAGPALLAGHCCPQPGWKVSGDGFDRIEFGGAENPSGFGEQSAGC
jgi:MFS family permease